MLILEKFCGRVRRLNSEVHALYLAARHPDTPWYAKLLVAAVVAYAVSPLDLIPDFVPIFGLLDDFVLVPLGAAVAIRMIPPQVMLECRERAQATHLGVGSAGRSAALVVVGIWLILTALCTVWAIGAFTRNTN